jgi:hypothetical protein
MSRHRRPLRRNGPNPHPKITDRELARVRRDGPAALDWQRRFGLAKARQMCVGLLLGGVVPFVGLFALGWSPASMLIYLAIDVIGTLAGDVIKLILVGPMLRHTHARDHATQQVLSIVGGLEDGSGTWIDHGKGVSPLGLFGIALACAVVLVPLLGAPLEQLGLGSVHEGVGAPWFREIAAGSVLLHLLQSLAAGFAARRRAVEEQALYLDCGGILGLAIGLMVLVWLPLIWGPGGVIAMLVAIFLFRLGFGAFALYWMPRVTRALQRQLATPQA